MDDDAGLLRSRRFLVSISLVLVCAKALQFTPPNKVSVLGAEWIIGQPQNIILFVWIAWTWAYLKYFYWYRDLNIQQRIKSAVQHMANAILQESKYLKALPADAEHALDDTRVRHIETFTVEELERLIAFPVVKGVTDWPLLKAVCVNVTYEMKMPRKVYGGWHHLNEWQGGVEIPKSYYRWVVVRAYIKTLLTTHYGAEYMSPFIIGVMPLFFGFLESTPFIENCPIST